MLYVNTIEFNGRKAVINSYSPEFIKELQGNMDKQLALWQAKFPKAIIKTERMTRGDTLALVAANRKASEHLAWEIGEASNNA